MLDKLQSLINDGTITVGRENGLYEPRIPILLGQQYLATVEGFRVDADPASLAKREYLVIVDFSTLNITEANYSSDLSNSLLNDGKENYSPISVTQTEESERFKRFDFVFSVSTNRRVFEFSFNTGLEIVDRIRFKVDIGSLENKEKDGTPRGCVFFMDVPVELFISKQSEQPDTITGE